MKSTEQINKNNLNYVGQHRYPEGKSQALYQEDSHEHQISMLAHSSSQIR